MGVVLNRRMLLDWAAMAGTISMIGNSVLAGSEGLEGASVIDAHNHLILPIEKNVELLNEAKIGKSVLLVARPHPERATDIAGFKREMAVLSQTVSGTRNSIEAVRHAMEDVLGALTKYPDRFIGFGQVPLDVSPLEIHDWVQKDIVDKGLRGIGEILVRPGQGGSIEPVLQAASDHGGRLPVLVHAYAPQTLDDIRAFAALAIAYPSVPVILGQLAGPNWLEAIEILKAATPNLMIDLSTPVVWFAPYLAAREIPERLIFASNAPYGDMVVARLQTERAIAKAGASAELRARIMGGTLASLVGLN